MRTVLILLLALPLAGCAEFVDPTPEETVVDVSGRPLNTAPTNRYLKAFVNTDERHETVAFDRADWYVAGLEKELHQTRWISLTGTLRVTREVVVTDVGSPDDLESRFRYSEMEVDETRKAELDSEWDLRLAEVAEQEEAGVGWLGRLPPGVVA